MLPAGKDRGHGIGKLEMSKDILEKGAIVQRDKETYAIAPHIPGGIIDPAGLRRIADVAEKYNAKVLKITSAQRIAIVGIDPKDIDDAWKDLGMKAGAAIGLCVRSIKICPGTTAVQVPSREDIEKCFLLGRTVAMGLVN